jgi:hypothetical protein
VSFLDANNAMAAGVNGTILKTTNGGKTWTPQTSGTTNWLYDIAFTDSNTATVVGTSGLILKSTNGGKNWVFQKSGTTTDLYGVSFADARNGTAVGTLGTILRTTRTGPTSVEERPAEAPGDFLLSQNFPNPFNPATGIRFQVSATSDVKLAVYDILGREVAVLVNEKQAPGSYQVRFNAGGLASGVYFYRLHAGAYVATRKMVLMR